MLLTQTMPRSAGKAVSGVRRSLQYPTRVYLILLVAISLLPTVLFAGLVLQRFANAERARYQDAALNASERIAAAVDRELAGLATALQALSTGRSIGERAYDRFYERAVEVKKIIGAEVLLKDETGQQLINTRVPFGTQLPSSLQDHEVRALRSKRAEVSDMFVGAFSQQSVISVTVPFLRDHEPDQLLTIAINPERFTRLLAAQALPKGWTGGIADRRGRIIAGVRGGADTAASMVPFDVRHRLGGESGAWQGEMRDGAPGLIGFVHPQIAPAWRIVVEIPIAIANAPLQNAVVPIAVGGLLALLASLALALWIGERAARQMDRLARSAKALGELRPVKALNSPVREINLVSTAIEVAARDLNQRDRERRIAEESLRRLNETLESAVVQRSAQLVQLQKQEAIGQLTGGIAHDFNNLLMAIIGSLELLEKRAGADPRIKRYVDIAMQGARRGASLTQRLLAFARRQELVQESIALPGLLSGMSDLLERSIGPSVEIAVELPTALPNVLADPHQLELALLNLAVNGRDAMPRGGRIVISARTGTWAPDAPSLVPDEFVVVSVRDAGSGMDPETLRRATEPFFTTKGVGKGTGLGLPMVQGFAEQSGGRLVVRSELGVGTTAEIWLPLASSGHKSGALEASASPQPGRPGLRVLIVDDDPLVLSGTAHLLEDLGYEALEASSGKQALQVLADGPRVDVLVTDYAMPSMNGAELMEKAARLYPSMPIILATGYSEAPMFPDGRHVRLGKPFTQTQLAAAIDQAQQAAEQGPNMDARTLRAV